jgi:hypothetical protein
MNIVQKSLENVKSNYETKDLQRVTVVKWT